MSSSPTFTVLRCTTGSWAVGWPPRPRISAVAAVRVKSIRGSDERVIVVLRSRVRGLVCPVVRKDSTPCTGGLQRLSGREQGCSQQHDVLEQELPRHR